MKSIILLLMLSSFFFISCNRGNSKQVLGVENIPETLTVTEGKDLKENDTIVYADEKDVFNTPYIKNVKEYFRKNNRYKDWDKNDKREVVVNFSTLKDGSNINVKIRKSSGVQKLDDEAVRLIQKMKYEEPAIDFDHKPVSVKLMSIVVFFPPK